MARAQVHPKQIGRRYTSSVFLPQGPPPLRYTLPVGVAARNHAKFVSERVLSRNIVAGPLVRKFCENHLDDLRRPAADFPYRFDIRRGAAVVEWIESYCYLAKGKFEGHPYVLNWWQRLLTAVLFGWVYRRGEYRGERRFRKLYLETGKGSGKTPYLGALGLYMLCADGEQRGEGFVCGKNAEQAGVVFNFLKAMVGYSPLLEQSLTPIGGVNLYQFDHRPSAGFLKKVSSESEGKGKSGPMPNVVIADEYHEHISPATLDFYESGTKISSVTLDTHRDQRRIRYELRVWGRTYLCGIGSEGGGDRRELFVLHL